MIARALGVKTNVNSKKDNDCKWDKLEACLPKET